MIGATGRIVPAQAWLTLLVLLVMFAVLALDRLPTWLVFGGTLTVMMTLRLASQEALIKGFSNVGVLTVAALFPMAAGMYSTGAISLLSQRLIGSPKNATIANLKLLPPIAIGSAFLNNTPMVAMMIPVVRDLKRQSGLAAPTLFMGLSFASILGGNITLMGGAVNLIVAGMVADAINAGQMHGMKPVAIFDLAWVGVPAAAAGLVYLIFIAPRLLSGPKADPHSSPTRRRYLSEFRMQANSNLDGTTLEAAGFAFAVDPRLVSIRRNGAEIRPAPEQELHAGDVLVFTASAEALAALWTMIGLVPAYGTTMKSARHQHQLVEVVVSANASAVGRHISELPLPNSPYELMLVGMSRDGQDPGQSLMDLRIEAGDTAILEVNDSFFYENRRETDFILTKPLEGYLVKRVDRAIVAALIAVAMIALAASGTISMLNSALLATLAMLITGCLNSEQAWRSIQWKTLVVLGAALGLESAVTGTGLAQAIAKVCYVLGSHSPRIGLGVIFVATILMTNVISNVATAAFMFPVALSMSEKLSVSFMPFAMVIMVAASCAFINPAGVQINLMVQREGGYKFGDFAKVGLPLTLIVGLVVVLLAPIVYGL
jgi:di/tricarboxylate transporter